jgi:hypothetical protein
LGQLLLEQRTPERPLETVPCASFRSACCSSPLSLGAAIAGAAAVESGGSKVRASVRRNAKLQLNGAGVRYKAIFKVYSGPVSVEQGVTPEAVLAAPGRA